MSAPRPGKAVVPQLNVHRYDKTSTHCLQEVGQVLFPLLGIKYIDIQTFISCKSEGTLRATLPPALQYPFQMPTLTILKVFSLIRIAIRRSFMYMKGMCPFAVRPLRLVAVFGLVASSLRGWDADFSLLVTMSRPYRDESDHMRPSIDTRGRYGIETIP
ncbi:hypothetical protein BV22DRAFT_106641 [Leucogyrophana mollusca]|uniref:Uncharacterized protein n=1 Tax=Leucogyrophana mollusca TaxID=85980 RepID=A0ACB8BX60_9AGAM|nr:hypothetical protein BV22DRAFT_106641 [Leucogyrophana mollusca]